MVNKKLKDCALLFVQDPRLLYYVTQRAKNNSFPLEYEIGAGGKIEPEEALKPEIAAARECHEELGFTPQGIERLFSFTLPSPSHPHLSSPRHVFRIILYRNERIILEIDKVNVSGCGWKSESEIKRLSSQGKLRKDWDYAFHEALRRKMI